MKRKIIGAAAAYLSGLFFASFFTDISDILMVFGVALVVLGGGIMRKFSAADFVMLAVSFLTAFSVSTAYTRLTFDRITAFDGTSGTFIGRVTDFDVYDNDFAVYTLKGRINGDISAKILLTSRELDATYGDIVTVGKCDFSAHENTYLFKTADYYRSKHIFLQAAGDDISVKNTASGKLRTALRSFRESTIHRFNIELGDDCGGFLAGMVFGEKDYLDMNLRTALYRSGIGHILAVSGLHVSIIAAVIMAVLRKLRCNKYLSFGVVNVLMLTLIALANCPISAIRAALMLDIMYSARLFRQQNDSLNSLSIAALLICLADPYAVLNSGFLLSLSGTFGIAVFGPYMTAKMSRKTWFDRAYSGLIIAICTTFSVLPACVWFFDETSLISPLTNLILVPLCTLSMFIGLLDAVTLGLLHILPVAGAPIRLVIAISEALSSWSATYISGSSNILPSTLLMLAILCILVFFFTGKRRKTAICVAWSFLICGGIYAAENIYHDRQCVITVLGRKTDAAVVISCNGHSQIIDLSGDSATDEYVRKYASVNGIRPERLILTENYDSRYSAYLSALSAFQPAEILTPEDFGDRCIFQSDNCDFMYSSGVLIIRYCDSKVTVQPADSKRTEGFSVFYGKVKNIDKFRKNAVYLDKCGADCSDFNNFEIVLSTDGTYKIRRL